MVSIEVKEYPENMEYVHALLLTMYYEQSEHLHGEFTEAYIKVSYNRSNLCFFSDFMLF